MYAALTNEIANMSMLFENVIKTFSVWGGNWFHYKLHPSILSLLYPPTHIRFSFPFIVYSHFMFLFCFHNCSISESNHHHRR